MYIVGENFLQSTLISLIIVQESTRPEWCSAHEEAPHGRQTFGYAASFNQPNDSLVPSPAASFEALLWSQVRHASPGSRTVPQLKLWF
jgi:hypothetical protein